MSQGAASIDSAALADIVDLGRYPVTELGSPEARQVIAQARASLAERGVAILPGFVRAAALPGIVATSEQLKASAFHEDVAVGTPYLELPDESYPEGHPRRHDIRSATWVIAYDQVPVDAAIRRLYEWDALMGFVGEVLDRRPLHRFADPLGAVNLAIMDEGDVQGWHYDSTDFVVSIALQSSTAGGEFECAPRIRNDVDENYESVAKVLAGEAGERVEVIPMTPGALMIFEGRHSIHRVSPVAGEVSRHVALMAYDTKPGTNSSDLLKMVRYGRTS